MWKELIEQLVASGLSMAEISRETKIPASTLSELRTETTENPRWDTGTKLLELKARRFPQRKRAA